MTSPALPVHCFGSNDSAQLFDESEQLRRERVAKPGAFGSQRRTWRGEFEPIGATDCTNTFAAAV